MKSIKKLFFSCALSLLMWQAYAQSPVTVFSGSSLPTAQGWTELKLDNTVSSAAVAVSSSVSNNALNIASTNAANQFSQLGWYKTGLNLNPQTGYTIEIKAKVTTADKTGAFNIQGFDAAGKGFRLGILNNAITELTNPLAATKTLAGGLTNDDDFHIYKLAVTAATVAVFRDGTLVGTFPLADFYWDNIIENGGFEDVDVPDFSSNGILARTNAVGEAYTGNYGFIINSDGRNQETDPKEMATTRAYPVKPGADYEFSLIARRLIFDNEWAWRDLGGYYDTQAGTLAGSKDPNVFWWNNPFENTSWKKQLSPFTPDAGKASIRFESPSWTKDGTKQTSKVGFDNVYLREKLPVTLGPTLPAVTGFVAPVIPDGVTNLIYNGDFENETMNNDGTEYIWALSNSPADQENTPVADNPIWGNNVRLQRNEKTSDNVGGDGGYAHSGTHSVRFSSLDINAKNVDFHVELEANKTYRFVFWHRNPGYNDWAWFFVRIGEQSPMWGHKVGSYANKWIPVDLTFTTTAEHKTLHLYSTSATHGGWYNQYFDDFTLYELTGDVADPQIAGKANLIENGDFEDVTKNNDGTNYAWALASAVTGSNDDNLPLAKNDLWGTYVRIQDKEKRAGNVNYTDWNVSDDTGLQWAHSGTKSLRFTTQSNGNPADAPIGLNLDFQKELEPNKTYTFVFWIKTAYFDDNGGGGALHIANDSQELMSQVLTNKWMNWTRQSVTFSTTAQNHTLRLYSDFSGWVNFYLDDLFLFEETNVSPPAYDGESFLFFGKSTSAYSANVDVEYVKVDNTGAYINTVEFNSNGGSTVDTQIVSGAATEPAVPTKTGYTFGGWYSDMAFTTPYDFATIVSSNIILYAKWTINSYTLTFESNGGSSVAPQTLEYNLKFTTPATPVKASHDFKGWYIDNETFATPYNFNTLATTNLTVYAKWELHELVLYLPFEDDLNDATSYARNPTAPNGNDFAEGVKGKALSLNQEDLTTGNQHLDWSFPNVINPAETPHSFSMWFYNNSEVADATLNNEEILIQQKDNGGTGRIGIGTNYNAATPEEGKLFNFYTNNRQSCDGGSFERSKWTHVVMTADPATKNIIFYINGVQTNSFVTVNNFEATIGGFVIGKHKNAQGWWHGHIDEVKIYKGILNVEEIAALYAEREQKTVTFNTNGGTTIALQTVAKQEIANEPTVPKKAGYSFAGWYADETLTTAYDFSTAVATDIIVYAKWEADTDYAETYYIDFGRSDRGVPTTGVDVNGNVWNNLIAPNGSAQTTFPATRNIALVNNKNENNGVTLDVVQNINANGTTGSGGLLNPDPALLGDFAIESVTIDYFYTDGDQHGVFLFKNLNPGKAYKFYAYGNRENTEVRASLYSVVGANGSHGSQQVSGTGIGANGYNGNNNNIWESNPVVPKANGEILFEYGKLLSSMAHICALKIVEVEKPDMPVATAKFYIDFSRNNMTEPQGEPTTSPDVNGNYWNNVVAEGNAMKPVAVNPLTLVTSTNTTTACQLQIEQGSNNPQFNGSKNGGLLNPNADLLGDLAIESATRDYIFTDGDPIVMHFNSLNPAYNYRFNIFGCRNETSNNGRVERITLEGANSSTGLHQVGGINMGVSTASQGDMNQANSNDNRIFVSDMIMPDASGQINLTLTKYVGMAHINIIKIEEFGDPITGINNNIVAALRVHSADQTLIISPASSSLVSIYDVAGTLVARENVMDSKTFSLPVGVYIVKAVAANGAVEIAKAVNK